MESLDDSGVEVGQVLAGKFHVERVLGRGGMGIVVQATHLQLDERVALKFLLPEALAHEEAVRRFEREARAAAKIKSEHVARVTDVGVLPSGSPYLVMEYLEGMDLGQYLEEQGPLPIDEAVEYVLEALEAIAEAHTLGIVHRDLKPGNLFRSLRADGSASIKVLDFGISKITTGDHAMTRTSSMMGSPYYMSPEQMTNSKGVDARADIWALGIILHELLSGRVPYRGETIPEICAQVLQEPPPSLRESRADIPLQLEEIVHRALAKNRDDRFPDVAAFAHALAPFAPEHARQSVTRVSRILGVKGAPLDSRGRASRPDTEGSSSSTLGGAAHTHWKPPTGGSGWSPLLLAAGAAVLLVALGAVWLLRDTESPSESALAPTEAPREPAVTTSASAAEPTPATPSTRAETEVPSQAPTKSSAPAPADTPTKPSTTSAPASATKGTPAKGAAATNAPSSTPAPASSATKSPAPTDTTPKTPPTTKPGSVPSDLLLDRK